MNTQQQHNEFSLVRSVRFACMRQGSYWRNLLDLGVANGRLAVQTSSSL
jgi:hypothetical protein